MGTVEKRDRHKKSRYVSPEKKLERNKRLYALQIRKRQILMRSDTKLPQPFASWSNSL